MSLDHARKTALFKRYFNHTLTEEEKSELMEWIGNGPHKEEVIALMNTAWEEFNEEGVVFTDSQSEKMLHTIIHSQKAGESPEERISGKKITSKKWLVAASLSLLLVTAAYFWYSQPSSVSISASTQPVETNIDLPPGGNKAVLTLSNGKAIILDSVENGALAQQGGTKVVKLQSGQLVYKNQNLADRTQNISFNTLAVPRGGQYKLTLPDGSKVWLNAASSLKFPTAFTGKKRQVELTGEAYFEISPDTKRPFSVIIPAGISGTNQMVIEVLGTYFNVNAYKDEPAVRTTLLEGSVRVAQGSLSRLLQPGQQAQTTKGTNDINIIRPNLDEVIAWKNGIFRFDNEDLPTIMRKISRWYDIEVDFQENVPESRFSGMISRNTNLSQVLQVLEINGVHFKIEGKKISVL
jgi:ferric-dicitrate binding protein FerR (iron transport regulator)